MLTDASIEYKEGAVARRGQKEKIEREWGRGCLSRDAETECELGS